MENSVTDLTNNGRTNKVILELIGYNREHYEKADNLSIEEIIQRIQPDRVNWVNVDGLYDQSIIEKLQTHFNLHSLLIEDVLQDQRPKVEEYDDYLFFTLKMLYSINGGEIEYEQISFVLGSHYLICFQEKEGDLFDNFRDRIRLDQGRVRKKKADYLLYRLIDIIVDNYYNVLDAIGEQIEDIEETLHNEHSEHTFQRIQNLKKELIYLRKAVYPLRDALSALLKDKNELIEEENERFFDDVYDHVVHLIDSLDTYKDLTSSLLDIHINTQNNQLNKIIKVLTIISTIFIPLTFIVGVYGMNFRYMPEIEWEYGYPFTWLIMVLMTVGMLGYFRFKKWF
ncbi:MAG: magnesium/cobalt transporter CorA [Cyclobacteriaceae bacterium]|nr:magnesium/cobalt transporter CorA [Cyclobacteriaceae bacterium]UYN86155.1 MAG: magnesium/cobalt transporter CorA [Cyclobacteriaceae bacterium]